MKKSRQRDMGDGAWAVRRVHRALPPPLPGSDAYYRRRHNGGRKRERLTVRRRIELAATRGSGSVLTKGDVQELWEMMNGNGSCGMVCERERAEARGIAAQVTEMMREVDAVLSGKGDK